MGGIRPHSSRELQIDNGYIRTLNLTIYRPKNNPNFWGEQVFCMKHVLSTVSVHTIDVTNPLVEQSLNKSLGNTKTESIHQKTVSQEKKPAKSMKNWILR